MCARDFVRAHCIIKLWKNPNGLSNDDRSSVTRANAARKSANVSCKKLTPTTSEVGFFRPECWLRWRRRYPERGRSAVPLMTPCQIIAGWKMRAGFLSCAGLLSAWPYHKAFVESTLHLRSRRSFESAFALASQNFFVTNQCIAISRARNEGRADADSRS